MSGHQCHPQPKPRKERLSSKELSAPRRRREQWQSMTASLLLPVPAQGIGFAINCIRFTWHPISETNQRMCRCQEPHCQTSFTTNLNDIFASVLKDEGEQPFHSLLLCCPVSNSCSATRSFSFAECAVLLVGFHPTGTCLTAP